MKRRLQTHPHLHHADQRTDTEKMDLWSILLIILVVLLIIFLVRRV